MSFRFFNGPFPSSHNVFVGSKCAAILKSISSRSSGIIRFLKSMYHSITLTERNGGFIVDSNCDRSYTSIENFIVLLSTFR